MSKQRILFLNVVIALLIVGSLYVIVTDQEYWPFSQYPMYSMLIEQKDSLEALRLFGVTQEEPHQEIPLRDNQYVQPFARSRLHSALKWIYIKSERNPEKRQQMLNEALLDCLKRYEELRLAGRHDGPPLQGMRLYGVRWQLETRAGNVDQPDYRKLLAEVEQP
jgi:hypothetical protein